MLCLKLNSSKYLFSSKRVLFVSLLILMKKVKILHKYQKSLLHYDTDLLTNLFESKENFSRKFVIMSLLVAFPGGSVSFWKEVLQMLRFYLLWCKHVRVIFHYFLYIIVNLIP